eukprot:3053411-Pyramimonas_sp.AAC.1
MRRERAPPRNSRRLVDILGARSRSHSPSHEALTTKSLSSAWRAASVTLPARRAPLRAATRAQDQLDT